MVVRHQVAISARSYAVAWAAEELGPQHPALLAPLHEDDTPLAGRIERAVAELERSRLFDRRGGLHGDLLTTFQLLARPSIEFYGWIATERPPANFSAVAAARGNDAVLAVLNGDALTLTPLRPDANARALVDLLPRTPPAHAQSITAPASDLGTGTAHGPDEVFAGLSPPQTGSPAAGAIRRLDAAPRTAAAQFYVAVRDASGRRHRNPYPLNVRDLPDGRWFVQHTNSSGQIWVTAAPASPQSLTARLDEIRRGLR
ncbi:ESX secretion-associated protein EspG [Gandjariella thermophila]|uniref:ESX secretion-associated protein EspG n=1 Tax=Gandjariella thermophila TaxID=1931992 RepID=A0A4D4JB09_9PSEU|nr:ESX secretion-associated protein EspG [Gandjariella thermophila]GDY31579.1 ESX secretion-associated protein EspG [Gandjariella thermophila]